MKIKVVQLKKTILPLLLLISLCFNILYLFSIIDVKIHLLPTKTQESQYKMFKHFWDSPCAQPDTIRNNDSIDRFKPKK
jgi:hypothetical protein